MNKSIKNQQSPYCIIFLILISGFIYNISIFSLSHYDQTRKSTILNTQQLNRTGKVFTNITQMSSDCFINRQNPSQNVQPELSIPGYILSHAEMTFENIKAINYTKIIEDNPTEVIISGENVPLYIYQKFFVEIDQYVNNVSIFIQDIINTYNFSEQNSWEVAIVNCTDEGIPSNDTIGKSIKPHPLNIAAHWETFDFLNSETGPIFLNTSNTYKTIQNGRANYWFAFRIKIPPDDTKYGGGKKFLYFNPSGHSDAQNGGSDTFLYYNNVLIENFTINYVAEITNLSNGISTAGNLESFKEFDEDRYNCIPNSNNLTLDTKFYIQNISSGILDRARVDYYANNFSGKIDWFFNHHKYLNSIDFHLVTNASSISNMNLALLFIKNQTNGEWFNLSNKIQLKQENETYTTYKVGDQVEKLNILKHFINYSNNNAMELRFDYSGIGAYEISYNLLTVNFGERLQINDTILPYDPLVRKLIYPSEMNQNALNGTITSENNLDLLRLNDDNFFRAQALTNNLSLEFKFNILPDVISSIWDVEILDWEDVLTRSLYPYPYIPQIDFRISSNVSINTQEDLDLALLEIYKGNKNYSFLTPEQNAQEWLMLSDTNKSLANKYETLQESILNSFYTWIVLQFINTSDANSIRMRLRYLGSSGFERFNVSVDEFTLNLYIQNVISSKITSKIGVGLNNNNLKPSDILIQNFGSDVQDLGIGTGYWEGNIDFGEPNQGVFIFNVSSIWNYVSFDVNGTYELYKIQIFLEFLDNLNSQYMTGNQIFSIRARSIDGNTIGNLNLVFELLDGSLTVKSEAAAITNNEGIASVNLQMPETGESYTVRVRFLGEGFYTGTQIISANFRIVNDMILLIETLLQILPYILAILAGLFVLLALRYQRHQKLRKIWTKEAAILDDLVNISYIMIIHKDSGLSIYNRQIALDNIDSDLVSGFLQAISQFRKEIDKKQSGASKGFVMDYYDFKIVISDGNYLRVALILDRTPSDELKAKQKSFTTDLELKYGSYLQRFTGDLSPFKDIDLLIEKYFNISLMYPLQLARNQEMFKLNSLEQSLWEVAEQIQKEKNFFFISNLLSFGIAGRKESRDQIISAILSLKTKGLLRPLEMK